MIKAQAVFELSESVRYVALYRSGDLSLSSRPGTKDASSAESDRYEELLVNPTILKMVGQRGNIDCGGLDYILIRYGNFFQFVMPIDDGHLSVAIEPGADAVGIARGIATLIGETA